MSCERLFAVAVAVWTAGALACLTDSASAQGASPAKPAPQSPSPAPQSPTPPAAAVAAPPETKPAAVPQAAPAAEPSLEAKERARVAYARGQAAFAGGDFAQAKRAFEEAFESVPNPIVLLSVAESAAKAGLVDDAIATLDRYLQLRPDAPDHAQIVQRRAALAVLPAHVFVTSEPAGADVLLDGHMTGKKAPAEIEVPPGDHQLSGALAGYETDVVAIHASAGSRLDPKLVMRPVAPPPPAARTSANVALETPAALPSEVPATALWVSGSIGAAGLIAGTVLGFLALKEHSDFESKPTEASADRGERLALFSDVGFGIGAMAAVTTAVLYLTHDQAPAASAQAHVEFVPKLSASSASATARIRF